MAIKKIDAEYLRQSKRTFTTLLNDVIKNITNSDALAVYTYLSSMGSQWVVIRTQIQSHFGWGRDKTNNALRWLNENLLLEYEQERLSDGTLGKCGIVVHEGKDFIDRILNKDTATLKNRSPVKPLTGQTPTNNKTTNNNKTKSNKRESAAIPDTQKEPLSDDFIPDEASALLCGNLGLNLTAELLSFKERHNRKKTQYEFRRWLENSHQFTVQKQSKSSFKSTKNEAKCTVPWFTPNH